MQTLHTPYRPPCAVCAAADPDVGIGACERAVVEGTIRRVERRQYRGEHGAFTGVHLHLLTAEGPCVLILGGRFAYLADGLAEAGGGVIVRAYHLRAGRAAVRAEGGREAQALREGDESPPGPPDYTSAPRQEGEPDSRERAALPRFLTTAESLVVLEPDWLVDVTSLNGTDYCLRQWLANRLAARPETLQKLRGTLVHTLFRALCQDGSVDEGMVREGATRLTLDLALLGGDTDTLLEAVAPHLERLQEWRGMFAAEVFADSAESPCYETTLLCPELGLRGRVDLALRRAGSEGPPLVGRIVELKTAKFNQDWPDPEFQVRGYYAILASQRRLAPDFKAQVIYTGSAAVNFRTIACGPEHIREVLARRNQAVLALLLGHAPPAGGNKCRRSANRADCVALSGLLGLTHCHGRDLADAASEQGDGSDASFYAAQYRLLRMEQRATGGALAALWREAPVARIAAGTAITATSVASTERLADGRWCYRLAVSNGSELRVGETVLLSDGDPVRGEVAVGTLLQVGAEMVEVAALEAVGNPQLIDRYDNGEALDRTVRALHAWLRAPAATRALLYGGRLPEVAMRAEGASRPATGGAREAAPGAAGAGEELIGGLSASRAIDAEGDSASLSDLEAHTADVCAANGEAPAGAAGARANGHGQFPALEALGGPITAARAATATIDRHIDPSGQAPGTAPYEWATIATTVAGGDHVEGGGPSVSQRPPQGATGGEADLNPRQAHALDLALRTTGYLLVQGPPGTGKTHLIARIVRALVARGERVLLSAWTNQALDTMLHALLAQGYRDFARLGSTRTLDPLLVPYALLPSLLSLPAGEGNAKKEAPTPGALAERMRTAPVVAGTVSMLSDPRIAAATLGRDVLILDEAAQLGLAASVGALRLAGRFILVGDDQQLPPVVQSEDAAREGLSRSPFAELRAAAESAGALVVLTEQYRMHESIAAWPSAAFYSGMLTPHSSVAARLLPCLPPGSPANPVTDPLVPLALIDAGAGGSREIELAARAVQALVRSGVPAAQIGVVAPFRAKVAAVRRLVEADERSAGCAVDTVDRFQGGQREVMVVCLGLDGIGRRGHAFVDDPRRLNVAFTRARSKLLVVGDLAQAAALPTLAGFLEHCREQGVPIVRAAPRPIG